MTPRERQDKILIELSTKPGITMRQLADIFGVSRRTIYRDIIDLSLAHPIYTVRGKYNGGVYLTENYFADWNRDQIDLMYRMLNAANHEICKLTPNEYAIVHNLIVRHSHPRVH